MMERYNHRAQAKMKQYSILKLQPIGCQNYHGVLRKTGQVDFENIFQLDVVTAFIRILKFS